MAHFTLFIYLLSGVIVVHGFKVSHGFFFLPSANGWTEHVFRWTAPFCKFKFNSGAYEFSSSENKVFRSKIRSASTLYGVHLEQGHLLKSPRAHFHVMGMLRLIFLT